jgi:hypothetical protein
MATWDDVRRLALTLPETTEVISRGTPQWRVKNKNFVWDRPLRGTDLKALGEAAPDGELLGVRTEHLGAKEALLAADVGFFTIPHFDGYPALLIRLDPLEIPALEEIVIDAWLARAPRRLADAYLAEMA